jgi:hypothetical protein
MPVSPYKPYATKHTVHVGVPMPASPLSAPERSCELGRWTDFPFSHACTCITVQKSISTSPIHFVWESPHENQYLGCRCTSCFCQAASCRIASVCLAATIERRT